MANLGLGTVQFGLDYGISNTRGRVPLVESRAIMSRAIEAGWGYLDTAPCYGESEKIVGAFLATSRVCFDRIISKFSSSGALSAEQVVDMCDRSLQALGVDSIYGYISHRFQDYLDCPQIWKGFQKLREEKKVHKIGFSLYHPAELERLIADHIDFDIVQIPFSVFDRRFEPMLGILKQRRVEVHVRSAFLQGLAFMPPEHLDGFFTNAKASVVALRTAAVQTGIPIQGLCLAYCQSHSMVDVVIIGVSGLDDLMANIDALRIAGERGLTDDFFRQFVIDDEGILLPYLWPNGTSK